MGFGVYLGFRVPGLGFVGLTELIGLRVKGMGLRD